MNISRGGGDFTSNADASSTTATASTIVAPFTAITANGEETGLIGTDILTIHPYKVVVDFWDLQDYLGGGEAGITIGGDLSNLPPLQAEPRLGGAVVYIPNGANLVGDMLDIPEGTYSSFQINYATAITGSLSNAPETQYVFSVEGCSLISGIYTPSAVCKNINLSGTNMSANDIDQTLINIATITTSENGNLYVPAGRTSASDAAVATLTGLGWNIS